MSVQTGTMPPPATPFHFHAGSGAGTGNPQPPHFRGYTPTVYNGKPTMNQEEYDGKRLRKSSMRKTVDYNCSVMKYLEDRVWQRGAIDRPTLQPDVLFYPELHPPAGYTDNPINAVTTRFVRTATNKMRCPIFCLGWTPEGRRLITGASSGEFTLWNGLTFNFETILQAHDSPVRTMVWSRNDQWMVTGDHGGYIKYWQMNMNNVKMFQAHKDPVRGISFSPSDHKLATCSDDGTVRIWDFIRCYEEKVLRGHGADVKCLDWHPHKGLVVSGSKDNQQPVRLWDPKSGQSLATLHAHKSTVMDLSFNRNGNWLLTASRDHLIKIFDIRNLGAEMQVFRGHKKEAASVSWHPIHETLFSSGGSDGAMMFWNVGCDKEVGCIDQAHDSLIWSMSWHPLGHVLASGSNDHTTKFWTRNRPGDTMQDKYNLNISEPAEAVPTVKPGTDESGLTEESAAESADADALLIPGMGPDDRVEPPPGEPDGERGEDDPRPTELHADGRRFPSRRPHWRFANHWNERWNQDFDQPGGDRGGRGGWRGRGRPDWRGRGRGAFRDRDRDDRRDNKDDRKDDKDGDGSGERRGRWPDRDGSRDSSRDGSRDGPRDGPRDDSREGSRDSGGPERKSGDDQMARDMDLRPDGSGRDFRGGRGATRGRCHADEPPGGGRDWARDGDEKMDVNAQLDETNGHSDGPSPSDGLRRGARGTFRGGDRGRFRDGTDRGGFRDQGRGGGFRDQGRGGFRDRGGFGRPEGDRGPGGFGNPGGDADGFGRPEGDRGRGGFGRLEGDRDGFGRPEGDRGRGGFGRPEGDRGGFGRSAGDRGGFGRPEGDRGGFVRPEGDQSGFGRPNGDRGGPPGLKGERDDTMLDRPPPGGQPGGEWRDGWRGRGGDPGWRGGGADEAKGGFHGGRGGWRGGDDQDEGGWRGGSGGNFRGRGSFREDERGGWRTRGRVRGPGPRRGRGDLY